MSSPASIKGHPLHPMLVALPIGLWVFSLACDVLGLVYPENWIWQSVALYALVGGIIGAFAAAVPGLVDLSALRVVLLGISGWLVGELVYKRGVAVAAARRVRARLS